MSFYKTRTTQFNYPFCQIAKDSREARSFLPADCVIQTGNRTRFVCDERPQPGFSQVCTDPPGLLLFGSENLGVEERGEGDVAGFCIFNGVKAQGARSPN